MMDRGAIGSACRRFREVTDETRWGARAQVDRFIPSRSALDLDVAHYTMSQEGRGAEGEEDAKVIKSPAKVRGGARRARRERARNARSGFRD